MCFVRLNYMVVLYCPIPNIYISITNSNLMSDCLIEIVGHGQKGTCSHFLLISSPGQRPCKLLPPLKISKGPRAYVARALSLWSKVVHKEI